MKFINLASALIAVFIAVPGYSQSPDDISTNASGEVITGITARATGGGSPFDGKMDSESDLDDLVITAWGTGSLGLHRGHRPIGSVLEAFLGISHREMHILMEQSNLNLADICIRFGFDPDNLVETLTLSFVPYIDQAVDQGVIPEDEAPVWIGQIQEQFHNRVYWEG